MMADMRFSYDSDRPWQGSELSGRPLKVPFRRLKETKFYVKGDYQETKSGAKGDFVQKSAKIMR